MTARRAKLKAPPGVVKTDTDYAVQGRYIDAEHCRFVDGDPQKLGGWQKLVATQLTGTPRGGFAWRLLDAQRALAIGTTSKLWLLKEDTVYNITPLQPLVTGTLTNAIATTNGLSTVTVSHSSHGRTVGEWVTLNAETTVGGLRILGSYQINSVATNTYTFDAAQAASATVASGGGSIAYEYDRRRQSNPFTMASGSPVVTVALTAHGLFETQEVTFSGAVAVGGLTISGAYTVTTVVDANTFTITASSNATSNASGGGNVDITAEIPPGNAAATVALGYGTGPYGVGDYGTPRPGSTVTIAARTWSFGAYGEWLCANPRGGRIYLWDPDWGTSVRARKWPGAPDIALYVLVAETRHVVVLGADGDPMNLKWSDDDDPFDWTPTVTNDANSRRLNVGSQLVAGVKLRRRTIQLWSDTASFLMSYTGNDFVFDTDLISEDAGLCGPLAMTSSDGKSHWYSGVNFYRYDGAVQLLPSDDIREWFVARAKPEQLTKMVCGFVQEFGEVWWWYESTDGMDVDSYVALSTRGQGWITGTMARSTWIDRSVWNTPIGVSPGGYIYAHETGVDDDTAAMETVLEMAPLELDESNQIMDIWQIIPDFKDQVGNLELYLSLREEPQSPIALEGPFVVTPTSETYDYPTAARLAGFKVRSNQLGGNWSMGLLQVLVSGAGGR